MLSRPTRRMRGLTLVELMVVVSIIGLLLIATMPSISSWMRNTQIRTTAESLLNGLSRARNEAVRRNTPVRFSRVTSSSGNAGQLDNSCASSTTSASWVVSLQDPAGACASGPSETTAPMILEKWARGESAASVTVATLAANSDGTCSSTASSATAVVFDGFGRVTSPASGVCLTIDSSAGSGNRTLNIVIATGGSVRMCDPAVTSSSDPRKC